MAGEPYPKMMYSPVDNPVMVNTVEEEQALGAPWRPEPYSPDEQAAWHSQQAQAQAHQAPSPPPAGQPAPPTEEPTDEGAGEPPPPRSRR